MRDTAPRGTEALVEVWKSSALHSELMRRVETAEDIPLDAVYKAEEGSAVVAATDDEGQTERKSNEWPAFVRESLAGSYWFHFGLTLRRQVTITKRAVAFIMTRVIQTLITSVMIGSLYSNIRTRDVVTMNGLLYGSMLSNALGSFAVSIHYNILCINM